MEKLLQKKRVERAIREWQRRLGLAEWDLAINWNDPCPDDADASTWRSNTYDRAEIKFDPHWRKWSWEFMNRIIVHELLHLVSRDIDRVVASVESQLHPEAWRSLDIRYDHEIEGLIDRLSYRFVEIGGCI